jgi:rhodanese-related sulfurtransferase
LSKRRDKTKNAQSLARYGRRLRIYPGLFILDQKESHMKTIHPIGLARLIATHQPFDLIDVRTKEEFDKAHIPGARSIPLPELRASKVLRDRKLPATEPLYVICRSRALAGLASGILEGAGCSNAVVVDGGMETWQAQGLPGGRKKCFPKIAIDAPTLAVVAGFGFGLGLAIHEVFFVVPLIVGLAALGPKIYSFVQRQIRQNNIVDLVRPGLLEDWAVPHASQFSSHLGHHFFAHPHHRVRFAKCH